MPPYLGPVALCCCPLYLAVLLCLYGMPMARLHGYLVLNPCPRPVLNSLLPLSLCRLLSAERCLAGPRISALALPLAAPVPAPAAPGVPPVPRPASPPDSDADSDLDPWDSPHLLAAMQEEVFSDSEDDDWDWNDAGFAALSIC
jgi:hypothetical protein